MTNKEIIIDGVKLEDIKKLLFTGQKMAISTKTFEAIIEQLERKTQECEELKEKYKWYDHYKEAALFNKELCDKKSDEIANCKQAFKDIEKIARCERVKNKNE